MQKILIVLSVLYGGFCGVAYATTVNYNWLVDGTNYAQTTCETGDDLILPTPSPTKYGYHFVGWAESEISGSWSQSGTPSPQNPIEPVFKPFGNTVLRAVGSGDNFVADSYNPETRTITRRIGVKVLDGTERWTNPFDNGRYVLAFPFVAPYGIGANVDLHCSHFEATKSATTGLVLGCGFYTNSGVDQSQLRITYPDMPMLSDFKQWLADQYNAGTPVTVYYPLATPTEERIQ